MTESTDTPTVKRTSPIQRRLWWAVGLCALLIVAVNAASGYFAPCFDVCYSSVSYSFSVDPPPVREGQRSALKRLASMIARCPGTSRYSVEWDEPGSGNFLGVREHATVYNRKTGNLQDSQFLRLSGVRELDIEAVASRSGDFDELRYRLMPQQEVVAETLGRKLQQAVGKGDVTQARRLLGQGADANYRPDETKYQIPRDIYVRDSYLDKGSPLRIAVSNGDVPMIRLLLEHGADVKNEERDDGALLTETSSADIVVLLIKHGAAGNESIPNPKGD